MAMELNVQELNEEQRRACLNTIGPNTFFMLVGDALVSEKPLSVVRMGDGEKSLYQLCKANPGTAVTDKPYGEEWLRNFGCYGIPTDELARRLKIAAEECTYFAPQIMGIQRDEFGVASIFAARERYIDNWFVRTWSTKLQDQLLKEAHRVMFLHGMPGVLETFARRMDALGGVGVCMEMSTWQQADSLIEEIKKFDAQLVLFAGGPANKYIAPLIANGGCRPKVVLDLGQAAAKEWIL